MLRLTPAAREALRPGEALVFDWHRVALCCAAAGEIGLRKTTTREVERRGFRPLTDDPAATPVFAQPMAYPHLVERDVEIDCHVRMKMRLFRSDLPPDLGLRISLGRADAVFGPPARHTTEGARP